MIRTSPELGGLGFGVLRRLAAPRRADGSTTLADRAATRSLRLLDAQDPRVESIWRALEAVARPVYFLSWGWIENWLAMLSPDAAPRLAVVTEGEAVVAACFLGRRRRLRHGLVPVRGLHLNATGVPRLDELCIEHNGILCAPGTTLPLGVLVALLPDDWDELSLPGVDADALVPRDVPDDYRLIVEGQVASPYVDLGRVRAAGDYLALLGGNTRAQIRRARRSLGSCELEVAATRAQALEIYDELVALHAESRRERGQPGAFADPWFEQFHRRLIARRFGHGEIELLRLHAGGETIGCTYNLIANGRVLFYQSGLARFDDGHVKPGYLCHAAAIEHAAAAGHATYDLLAGQARYKTSLATDVAQLAWLRVQRRLARFAVEDQARQWMRVYAGWRSARAT